MLESDEVIGCPAMESLGLFGQKWALLIIRDLALYPGITFGQLSSRSQGITQRTLFIRLGELRSEGPALRTAGGSDSRVLRCDLTEKGKDVIPIMMAKASYCFRHLSGSMFQDGEPRMLSVLFPGRAREVLRQLADFASSG